MYGLYWIAIILFLIVDVVSIMHWDVDGLKSEKNETDKMIRGFRDATAITIILSGLGFLAVIFLREINEKVKEKIEEGQKDYYLREKLRAIKEELGDSSGGSDIDDLKEKLENNSSLALALTFSG